MTGDTNDASVVLRFSTVDIEMENRMRKFATRHIDFHDNDDTCGNNKSQRAINIKTIDHALLQPEPLSEPNNGPITGEDMEEFVRVIQKGRDGLCGECSRRAAEV